MQEDHKFKASLNYTARPCFKKKKKKKSKQAKRKKREKENMPNYTLMSCALLCRHAVFQ
jgi:hypothetical protein